MATVPNLLDSDGSASIATAVMMSHHAIRRDLARFARALEAVANGDTSRLEVLREEWQSFRDTLHGHHAAEDNDLFPQVTSQEPSLRPTIEHLTADHRRIDPLLERGDRAFAALPGTSADAAAVIAELSTLLDAHLATEEDVVIPLLRSMKEFPPPPTDADADLYAQGFAWSMHGIAPDVLDHVYDMLPESLTSRLPAARSAFTKRFARVWGTAEAGASRTPIPGR